MTINPVILKLTSEEVLRLKRIFLDEDKEEALLVSQTMPQTSIGPGRPWPYGAGLREHIKVFQKDFIKNPEREEVNDG